VGKKWSALGSLQVGRNEAWFIEQAPERLAKDKEMKLELELSVSGAKQESTAGSGLHPLQVLHKS
jgi:hypothetical protein